MNKKELTGELAALRAEVAALRAELASRPYVVTVQPQYVQYPSWPTYPQITCSTDNITLRSVS